MNAPRYLLGTSLCPEDQAEALARFVHRYTGDHTPRWVERCRLTEKHKGIEYKLQFRDDQDWLANTEFRVTSKNRLSRKVRFCHSRPTWPLNPELRGKPAPTVTQEKA